MNPTTVTFVLISMWMQEAAAEETAYIPYEQYDTDIQYTDTDDMKAVIFPIFLFLCMLVMMSSNRGQFDQARDISSMNQRILRAVYSQPSIKKEIAHLVNDDLGHVPPIADLTSFGAHAQEHRAEHGKRFAVQLGPYFVGVFVAIVGLGTSLSLEWYVALLVLALILQFAAIHYGGLRKPFPRDCKCCACGKVASTISGEEYKGGLDVVLLNCSNCNDTGVCGPTCPTCNDSNSMTNTLFKGPAACYICSIYKYMCGACGSFVCRLFRSKEEGDKTRM
jgi:hypothetical protein